MTMRVLDAAELQQGYRVLDVGCGDGDTTLLAARRVGPRGLALGVDDSASRVERARRRASAAGLANVGFVRADARKQRFAPLRFDVVVSRLALTRVARARCLRQPRARSTARRPARVRQRRRPRSRALGPPTRRARSAVRGAHRGGRCAGVGRHRRRARRTTSGLLISSQEASARRCPPTGGEGATGREPRSGGPAPG